MFSNIRSRSRLQPDARSNRSLRGHDPTRHRSSSPRRNKKRAAAAFRSTSVRPPRRICREAFAEVGSNDIDLTSVEQGIKVAPILQTISVSGCFSLGVRELRVANYSRRMKRLVRHLRVLEGLGFETTGAMAALISTNNSLKDAIALMHQKEWDREERSCRKTVEYLDEGHRTKTGLFRFACRRYRTSVGGSDLEACRRIQENREGTGASCELR